jgi:peptidoglycan/LPS O-acetylase OafA/YrhL
VVVVVLVTFVGLTLLISSVVARQEAWGDGIASLLSVANIRFIAVSTDYFAPVVEPSPFLQMWSLSVEEQFYLVWPALLVVAFTLLRRNRQLVALAVGVISLTSLLLFLSGVLGSEATFYSLPTRAWELGLGAYIAIRGTRSNLSQTTALLLLAAAFIAPVFNADLVPGASVLTCVAIALIIAREISVSRKVSIWSNWYSAIKCLNGGGIGPYAQVLYGRKKSSKISFLKVRAYPEKHSAFLSGRMRKKVTTWLTRLLVARFFP